MPNELEYIVKDALMMCDKGALPVPFMPTFNTHIKVSGCLAATKADKIPMVNIPSFGACAAMGGSPCVPAPIDWLDTYKVKVKGQETILFKSMLPCGTGGKIEFITSGQVPLPPGEMEALMAEHGEQEEEGGLSWWDAAELIPFVGGVIGVVRSAAKDPTDWWGVGLSAASVVLDVAGLFSFGAGNAASAAVKTGKLARAGAKVMKVASKGAKVAKLTAKGAKGFAKAAAKSVDNFAMKTGKVCVFACFPEGTPIAVEDGHKNIEDVNVGDMVWAYNEATGESDLKKVVNTMQRAVDATIEITLGEETIETTAEHPFFTRTGWKDAADLTTDDEVKNKDGKWRRVEATNFLYSNKKVFNFEVSGWHTYFVGAWEWLVHNAACIVGTIKKISKRLKYMGRTPGKSSRTGREVFERMMKTKPKTARIKNGKKQFRSKQDNKWYDLDKADMSHKKDAVTWWNETGRKFGPKSKEVREWMLKSKNYYLEHRTYNRRAGALIGETYKIPL